MGIVKASTSKGCSEDWVKYIAGIFQTLSILSITTIIVKSVCLWTFTRCTIFFSGHMGIRMDSLRASKLTTPWRMFSAFHAAQKEYKIFREEVDGWRCFVLIFLVSTNLSPEINYGHSSWPESPFQSILHTNAVLHFWNPASALLVLFFKHGELHAMWVFLCMTDLSFRFLQNLVTEPSWLSLGTQEFKPYYIQGSFFGPAALGFRV